MNTCSRWEENESGNTKIYTTTIAQLVTLLRPELSMAQIDCVALYIRRRELEQRGMR